MHNSENTTVPPERLNILKWAFHFASIIASIVPSFNLTGTVGVNITRSFCDDHEDLCNQHQSANMDNGTFNQNLLDSVKEGNYLFGNTIAFMIAIAILPIFAFAVWIPLKLCPKKENKDSQQLLFKRSETKSCCNFFKKFRENVFPSKRDIYNLIVINILSIAGGCFLTWLCSIGTSNEICQTQADGQCSNYPNVTNEHELHELLNVSKDAYNGMMSTGIILSFVFSLGITLSMMTLAASIKYCTSRKEDERTKISYGTAFSGL